MAPKNGESSKLLRVVEFFSGVGGLHCAVKDSGLPFIVVAAVEINTVANAVYRHNFPDVNLLQRNIEGFSTDDFAAFDADMFILSPPCQPFTRVGLRGDSSDARTNAFFNIMRNLPQLSKRPTYILVENVKGFETSETRNFLVETLDKCQYAHQEFLLSPMDIGIPNQRVRYFLLAKQLPLEFKASQGAQLIGHRINVKSTHIDTIQNEASCQSEHEDNSMVSAKGHRTEEGESLELAASQSHLPPKVDQLCEVVQDMTCAANTGAPPSNELHGMVSSNVQRTTTKGEIPTAVPPVAVDVSTGVSNTATVGSDKRVESEGGEGHSPLRTIEDYLQSDLDEETLEEFYIPDKILMKFGHMMDIVTAADTKTRCFTKAYAHYVEGTGSILRTDLSTDMSQAFLPGSCSEEERLERLRALKLRYFTPREMANLHHFPASFSFPDTTTKKQRYRLIGNSLNVTLVSQLINYLLA